MSALNRRWFRILLAVVVLFVLTVGLVDYFCVDLFGGIFIPVTAQFHYPQILSWLRRQDYPADSDVLEFFPAVIPDHATNRRMFFQQLPGDLDFELRCTLPADEVMALVRRVTPVALATGHSGDEILTVTASHPELMNPQVFDLADGPGRQNVLPDTWVISITNVGHSKVHQGFEEFYESGIAVNPQTNDVIYWLKEHAQ
jgi:hypothetical protein